MRALRILLGSLLWIVAGLLLLLGVVLSVTVILLPVGIPLFMLGRRLMSFALALFLPRPIRHPVDEGKKSAQGLAGAVAARAKKSGIDVGGLRKKAKKKTKRAWKKARKAVA